VRPLDFVRGNFMAPKPGTLDPIVRAAPSNADPTDAQRAWHAEIQARLSGWFAVPFELLNGHTGETLSGGTRCCAIDALSRAELCRSVARRGRAEFIEENGPLLTLAIPVYAEEQHSIVAVAMFVTSHEISESQLAQAAAAMELPPAAVRRWISAQHCWQPSVLLNMGQLATERLAAEGRHNSLDRDIRDLTLNLSTTYEEISLIYRLTQNLKLNSGTDELVSLALEWLADAVPAECLMAQVLPSSTDETGELKYLSFGNCTLSEAEFADLLESLDLRPATRPLIINDTDMVPLAWRWPAVRQMVVVSLCEGANCFGWLMAINHAEGGEFGTVEASLLSSVAAILGIHGGNAELYQQQRELMKGVVRALTSAIDAKDPYTCGHSDRVARIAVRLAQAMGYDAKQLDTIYLSGLLHDVGKIGIDDQVLRKPGRLTEAEYDHIKNHTKIGHRILSDIKLLGDVLPAVLHHHEQWNGGGYPDGLAGEEIPLLARIVAVADSFDAMHSDRPYRPGMPDDKLDAIMAEGAGRQWDPKVIETFFRVRDDLREITNRDSKPAVPDLRELA
jgi:hypothetical protein